MSDLSDEDPPELVSTDEEEDVPIHKKKPVIGPEIPPLLKRDSEVAEDLRAFLRKEDRMQNTADSLRILILDPFLFGTDNSAKKHNKAWIAAAVQKFGFLPKSKDKIMHAVLGHDNMLAVELLENACAEVHAYLWERKLDTLKMFKITEQIKKEHKDDKLINVDQYLDDRIIEEMCGKVLKTSSKDPCFKSAAKFAVLYVLNTWVLFASQKFRLATDITDEVDKEDVAQLGEELRIRGNEKFKSGNFTAAIVYYQRAIEENPHCYVYYGNRAQAYLRLKKFLEAASDGRRAVSLKPDWIKGLYRYAEALAELTFYEEARVINDRAANVLKHSRENNSKDKDKVDKQRERIRNKGAGAEDKENKAEKLNKIEKTDEKSKSKRAGENGKSNIETKSRRKKISIVEVESDDDIPDLASAESSSDDDDISILDRASEIRLSNELKSSKPRDHEEFRMHQDLMEKKKHAEKILVEGKKRKEALRREKIQEETMRKEKEKARELAEANKKVEPEKKKGSSKHGTLANPVKLQKSSRQDGSDLLQSVKAKDNEKLKNLMGMGSDALFTMRCRNAIDYFIDAIDFIRSKNLMYFGMDIVDMMVLKYAKGVALIEAGTLQRILDGLEAFQALLKDYPKQSFPLAYYGIGKGYIKQNRYHDALEPLDHGFAIVKNNSNTGVYTWPGTTKVIEETYPGKMREAFESLLNSCRHPPHPDAVCFFAECHGFYKKEIYSSDPDFEGYVQTTCFADCRVDFHPSCWKKFRTVTEDRHSEKDYLERPCFTPDCYACIIKIIIFDKDNLKKKEFISENDHRTKDNGTKKNLKLELSNVTKIKRREEKKALRKQRKLEAKAKAEEPEESILEEIERHMDAREMDESASATTEDIDSRSHTSHTTGGGVVEEDPLPKDKDMMVLKKEVSAEEKYKVAVSKKNKKKKKDKAKVTLTLDEFVGRDRSKEEEDDYDPDKPFSVPSQLRSNIDAFENSHFMSGSGDSSVALTPTEEEIASNLYCFFEDHLLASGPVYLHNETLAALLEDFPPEANDVIRKYKSLSNFLLQNLKFAMIDEHLCLLKDTVKAKRLADEKNKGTKYQSYSHSVSANSTSLPSVNVTHTSSGTALNPAATEFNPVGLNSNPKTREKTRHGGLSDFDLPTAPPLANVKRKPQKYTEEEFPVLSGVEVNRPIRSESASRASLSDSLSSSCDDLKGNVSDSKVGSPGIPSPAHSMGGSVDVPPFLSGPPGAAKNKMSHKPRSRSSEKVPPFLSGPPLARNVSGSPNRQMASPKPASPKRISPKPSDFMENKRNVADDFKRQVLEKLQLQRNDGESEAPPTAKGSDLGETYESDSGNSLDDLDGVDDVVVTATDTQKLDGEVYDANLDTEVNKTFQKAVGNERSVPKTMFDSAQGVSSESVYGWNAKELNRANDLNGSGKSENGADNLMHKMQLAKEAWNSPVSSMRNSASEFSNFPSVHSGPGFGGLPIKIPPTNTYSNQSETTGGQKFENDSDIDDIDDGNIFSEIMDSNSSMEREIDNVDDDFVREFSESVMDGLRSHSAFADNSLTEFVRFTIQKDLQRCAVSKALNSAIGSHFSGNNSGRGSMNKNILHKPAILCRSIAVQSEPLRGVDQGVQTDPYEPYKLERDALQQQLIEKNQHLTQAKQLCNTHRQRYFEMKDSFEEAKKRLVTNSADHEREILQMKHECHQSQEEVQVLQERLALTQGQEQSLIARMNEMQQAINELSGQKKEESERMMTERNHHLNIIRQLEATLQQNVTLARKTEVDLLEFKLDIGMQLMEKHMKDADHYFTNLQAVVKKLEDGKHPIHPQLLKSVEQWQKTKDSIQDTAQNCKQSFQEQINQVKEGAPLASLPALDLPRAPPPPDPLPPQLLRVPPSGASLRPGPNAGVPNQSPSGQGMPQQPPTEPKNSPSPPSQTPSPTFPPRPQGPVLQSLPPFTQMPKQPPGMLPGGRPAVPPGVQMGPVPSGLRHAQAGPVPNMPPAQAMVKQEASPSPPFLTQTKPTATVNPTGGLPQMSQDRPKMPPGFQGPSAGPFGLGLPNQPPLSGPPGAAQGPPLLAPPKKTAAPKNSFEKIMVNLTKMFPKYKRQQLMGFVQRVRTVRGGSLSGMTLDDIICEVANLILEGNPGAVSSLQMGQNASDLHRSSSSSPCSGLSGNQTPISNFDEEDPCIICHEEMTPGNCVSLDCGHIYHDECIRKWLQEQRTCPTCRKYALLADEFPSLG